MAKKKYTYRAQLYDHEEDPTASPYDIYEAQADTDEEFYNILEADRDIADRWEVLSVFANRN